MAWNCCKWLNMAENGRKPLKLAIIGWKFQTHVNCMLQGLIYTVYSIQCVQHKHCIKHVQCMQYTVCAACRVCTQYAQHVVRLEMTILILCNCRDLPGRAHSPTHPSAARSICAISMLYLGYTSIISVLYRCYI